MTATHAIVQGDTLPEWEVSLASVVAGVTSPLSLVGATVACVLVRAPDGSLRATPSTVVSDPAGGIVRVSFAADTFAAPGTWLAQFVVSYPGGGVLSLPSVGSPQPIVVVGARL